ncbi:hypothetical protein, partial [Candidatus Igneacidithiobacillus taiwanensis]|uniref:hypothetical protein n=1 Tax=Candidatus Igneacidithiobacillus taiwanensis TaxID=1945924 RepID=UPI002896F3A3
QRRTATPSTRTETTAILPPPTSTTVPKVVDAYISLTSTRSAIDNRETFARTIGVSGGEEKDQDEF